MSNLRIKFKMSICFLQKTVKTFVSYFEELTQQRGDAGDIRRAFLAETLTRKNLFEPSESSHTASCDLLGAYLKKNSVIEDIVYGEAAKLREAVISGEKKPVILSQRHLQEAVFNIVFTATGSDVSLEETDFRQKLFALSVEAVESLPPSPHNFVSHFVDFCGRINGKKDKTHVNFLLRKELTEMIVDDHIIELGNPPYSDFIDHLIDRKKFEFGGTSVSEVLIDLYEKSVGEYSSRLEWLLSTVARCPERQSLIRQEIRRVCGRNRVRCSDSSALVVLTNFVKETLHLYEKIERSSSRIVQNGLRYQNYVIPKGAVLIGPPPSDDAGDLEEFVLASQFVVFIGNLLQEVEIGEVSEGFVLRRETFH